MYKALCIIGLVALSQATMPTDDLVASLDQMPDLSFGLYSGYVKINDTSKELHYVAALSQNNYATDPVIVWFNGGPGCSSMLGWLQEHGPYVMEDGTTTFVQNQYAWNQKATVIYLESPAGVGFSRCPVATECKFTDTNSAQDNYVAVLNLFIQKFPDLQKNDLYIAGESYAGIYIPLLVQILDSYITNNTGKDVYLPNLKGFMVGNGLTTRLYDGLPATFEMGYFFGLIDSALYNNVKANCDLTSSEPYSANCSAWLAQYDNLTTLINPYDYLGTCYNSSQASGFEMYQSNEESIYSASGDEFKTFKNYFTAQQYTPFMKKSNVGEIPQCVYGVPIQKYLTNDTVRTALHIPTDTQAWQLCADNFNYTGDVNGTLEVYTALKGKYKILKYSGDTDGVIPTQGTKNWIDYLNWNVTNEWKQYFVDGQVGGFVEYREGNFTFATVHGAGHMAPQWKRPQTYHVIFNFINDVAI